MDAATICILTVRADTTAPDTHTPMHTTHTQACNLCPSACPKVDLVQASNYSWFGYPEDTSPSARNFVPGLGRGSGGGSEGGSTPTNGGSAGCAGSSPGGGRSSSSPTAGAQGVGAVPTGTAAGDARERMEAAASRAAASSQQLQELLKRLGRELAQGAPVVAAQHSSGAPEQQPTVVLMGFGSSSSQQQNGDSGPSRSHSASDRFSIHQQQQPNEQPPELVCSAPGSSSGGGSGIFGGKLSWQTQGQQPVPPQQPPQQQDVQRTQPNTPRQPIGKSMQRQQQVAALNALRLQAGRGYTLEQLQGTPLARCAGIAAISDNIAQRTLAELTTSCSSSLVGNQGAAEAAPTAIAVGKSRTQPAEHSTNAAALNTATIAQQGAHHEPQHRKLRRRRGSAQAQREKERQTTLAVAPHLDPAPAPAVGVEQNSAAIVSSRMARGCASAAALAKQLHSLQAHSGKLYTANPAHPLQHLVAKTAAVAAEAKIDEASPTPPAAVVRGTATAEPAMTMTAEQRQEAVVRINRLPALMGTLSPLKLPAVAASSPSAASNSSMADGSAACGQQLHGTGQAGTGAASRVNRIGVLQAPEELKPSSRVSRAAYGAYAAVVVDPAVMQRKKGGLAYSWHSLLWHVFNGACC